MNPLTFRVHQASVVVIDGMRMPDFHALRDAGILHKARYRPKCGEHIIVWTALVPCVINGIEYQVGGKIIWNC